MHCLGTVVSGVDSASPSGTSSSVASSSSATSSSSSPPSVAPPSTAATTTGGVCSRGAVMSVVRALGVLVCEGRLQGPPRGYKEGPHCAAPLQPFANGHVCEKDNYLCARYVVLVREIAERISAGSTLSIEVSMCTDCPCGLARATCLKKPPTTGLIGSGPPSLTQWQLPSADVLLEYWSIGVVPSKNSETMNAQGLYQAVRSRLHFSQVAAWWSRSNGTRPTYVTTRIVPHGDENLRKFRGIPIEHTFPLAAIGDGNSIKVTVWALPRMEEVPTLFCPLHPTKENEEAARALTPTKMGPMVVAATSNSQAVENLVLPALVDDRLQTACDKPGKHHCHCEDEETSPPSMMIMMMRPTNGERKRRRSLPCGPPGNEGATGASHHQQIALPPVRETGIALRDSTIDSLVYGNNNNNNNSNNNNYGNSHNQRRNNHHHNNNNNNRAAMSNRNEMYENTYLSTGSLERRFRKQASLEETRMEPEVEKVEEETSRSVEDEGNEEKRYKPTVEIGGIVAEPSPNTIAEIVPDNLKSCCSTAVRHPRYPRMPGSPAPNDRGNDITDLMSKLSFPGDKKPRDDSRPGIPDWLNGTEARTTPGRSHRRAGEDDHPSELKLRNCSLELSQREFNEVLAVLRTRTPITRRRAAVPPARSLRRRERLEDDTPRSSENGSSSSGATAPPVCPVHRDKKREPRRETKNGPENPRRPGDALLGAILRTSERTELADASNGGARPRKILVATAKSTDPPKPEEHDRYLPNVFNKRLSRLRQLFQKEIGERNVIPEPTPDQSRIPSPDNRRLQSDSSKSHATPIRLDRRLSNPRINGQTITPPWNRRSDVVENPEDEATERGVPSASEQEQFRRSFENAASMVFHSRTGLPLTSSPAPLRRGHCCFDYDSTLNSVSSKRSALFELNTPPSPGAVSLEETDREVELSGEGEDTPKRPSATRVRPQSHALLGSFEESALNGRLEPVSTVHGFTAELGASGSFCPKHRKLPVTVFFYTLGDNDKVSTPYLAHINLGKKGYQVPRSGTIQVTLLNPLGTVVKMFVVLYDLSDMPPRSHTFLRQRTLRDKTLRYLVHLRFMSGKSGRIYLHTDIRMIICRKSDVDTASDFGSEPPKELRSYIHGPTNPKFSPRC